MPRLQFIAVTNFLIALFVLHSPIAVDAVDHHHELVKMANEYINKMMPSLEKLYENGKHSEKGPTKILGENAEHLKELFIVIMEETQDYEEYETQGGGNDKTEHEAAILQARAEQLLKLLADIKDHTDSGLRALKDKCFGPSNPISHKFTRNQRLMSSANYSTLNAGLKEKINELKKELETNKKLTQLKKELEARLKKTEEDLVASNFEKQQLANISVETLYAMDEKMESIPGRPLSSVPGENLRWALSTLAVNLWAFAALGVPGAEEAAKISEQVHPIVFPAPKGSRMEEVESSNVKKVAGKMHGTGGAGHSTP